MGQHKYNPTAQLAKEGKLPPKPKPMGKREAERLMMQKIRKMTGIDKLEKFLGDASY